MQNILAQNKNLHKSLPKNHGVLKRGWGVGGVGAKVSFPGKYLYIMADYMHISHIHSYYLLYGIMA